MLRLLFLAFLTVLSLFGYIDTVYFQPKQMEGGAVILLASTGDKYDKQSSVKNLLAESISLQHRTSMFFVTTLVVLLAWITREILKIIPSCKNEHHSSS
jgi:hypothetical protein